MISDLQRLQDIFMNHTTIPDVIINVIINYSHDHYMWYESKNKKKFSLGTPYKSKEDYVDNFADEGSWNIVFLLLEKMKYFSRSFILNLFKNVCEHGTIKEFKLLRKRIGNDLLYSIIKRDTTKYKNHDILMNL